MVLFYCEKCGTRVDPEDLQAGTARRIDDNRALCLACCSQERSATASTVGAENVSSEIEVSETEVIRADSPRPDSKTQRLINKNANASTQKAHAIGSSAVRRATGHPAPRTPPTKTTAVSAAETVPAGPNKWAAFGLGAGVVLLGVTIALLKPFSGSGETTKENPPVTETPTTETVAKTPEPPPVPDVDKITPPPADLGPHAMQAHIMLEEAKLFARKNPADTDGFIERLDQIYNAYRFTPAGQESQALLQKTFYPDPATQLAPESAWSAAVNLAPLPDAAKDIVSGKWKREGSKWIVEPERTARLQIPYEPPEEYDFRIVFSRVSGEEDVNMMLAAKGKMLMWSMSPSKNSCMGFETINGKDAQSNPDSIRVKPALDNNTIHTCVVQVRKRVVRAYLNGKFLKEHRTNYSEFGMRNDWKMKNDRLLGLGGHNSKIIFDRIELRPVSGTGRNLR